MQAHFTIAIERGDDVPPGSLYLKPVPGLLGRTVDEELFRSRPGAKAVKVSAGRLSARLHEHASFMRSDGANPGELANPRELGMARVGAFYEPAVRGTGCANFSTRLSAGTPASTVLVYVDRPGSVRGLRYTKPYILDYRLEFPAAGIYAIDLRRQGIVVTPRTVKVATLRATVTPAPCTAR